LACGVAAITISLRLKTIANRILAPDSPNATLKVLRKIRACYAEQKLKIRYYCRRRLANAL